MPDNSIIRSWNGKTIRQRPDGSLSLTDMANACGKLVKDWFQLKSTASYLVTLVRTNSEFSLRKATSIDFTKWGFSPSQLGDGNTELIETFKGSIGNENELGSWAHRRPALRFAQWCSDDFAIQVDTWIEELLTTGKVDLNNVVNNQKQLPPPEQRLDTLVSAMDKLAKLTGGELNPTMQQHLKDFAGNLLAGTNQIASSETKENWLGVVNFAEMELDSKCHKKGTTDAPI